jgi:hypothetical protein
MRVYWLPNTIYKGTVLVKDFKRCKSDVNDCVRRKRVKHSNPSSTFYLNLIASKLKILHDIFRCH